MASLRHSLSSSPTASLRRLPLPTGLTPQRCHLIVYRSCPDVEGTQLCSLLNELYHKPVVPAGILLPPDTGDDRDRSDMMRWLDKQLARSVVYIALGTEAPITSGNVRELDSSRHYATPASGCRRGTRRGVVEMRHLTQIILSSLVICLPRTRIAESEQ
ncbi:hypothetical protein OsI_28869 [Oryza sativa Indica Group]|uniref:Uncharacterized protein n=1 Tax=Oryza sativa subsp. indica TaxID=39946 RepID=A2YU59_ORYSI|nr:hypothetical protein OsI_28869 [Oryza sativa Indica Group]